VIDLFPKPMAFDAALGRAIGAGERNTKNSHNESPVVRAAGLSGLRDHGDGPSTA